MLEIDHLNLLSLTIALSAYVGAVRLAMPGRITAYLPQKMINKKIEKIPALIDSC